MHNSFYRALLPNSLITNQKTILGCAPFIFLPVVAILEPIDREGNIGYNNLVILRANLSKAVTNTSSYEVYERTDIDAIMSEHNFQRTGLVEEEQIKKLGEMTGAEYVLVAEVVIAGKNKLFVTAKLLDVETARTIIIDNMEINIDHMQKGCDALAKKMFPSRENVSYEKQEQSHVEGPLLVRNSKMDQDALGLGKYSLGDMQMNEKEMLGFLRNNSYEVYRRYLKGETCVKVGWCFMGVGIASAVATCVCSCMQSKYENRMKELSYQLVGEEDQWYDLDQFIPEGAEEGVMGFIPKTEEERNLYMEWKHYNEKENSCSIALAPIMSCTGIFSSASVVLLSVGYGIKNNIHKQYNERANTKQVLTLNFQANQNGIGLALNF